MTGLGIALFVILVAASAVLAYVSYRRHTVRAQARSRAALNRLLAEADEIAQAAKAASDSAAAQDTDPPAPADPPARPAGS